MARDELDATTDVVTLAEHVDGFGTDVARRLEDHGIETVADILIAEEGALTDVRYVSDLRADTLREAVADVADEEPDPLVDSREVALDATLGEKLTLTMADRDGYANPWAVIDTAAPTTWETATGDTWQTRRIRISQRMDGSETHRECDLVVAADEIRLEDPPVQGSSGYAAAKSWRIESVGAVGRVSQSVFVQLQGRVQDQEAHPEGDDTWRQYHRGETA